MNSQPVLNFVYRNPIAGFHSIERVFALVKKEWSGARTRDIILPFNSNGLLPILLNILWLKRYRKGIFHVTGHAHYAVLGLPRRKTILTIHDLGFLYSNSGIKRWVLKKIFLDWPLKRVNTVTTVSEKTKNEIIHNTGCSADRILVIPNPTDPDLIVENRHFNIEKPRLLFLGTKSNKNLDRAIAALYRLPVHLRIIGELEGNQSALIEKFNIEFSATSRLSDDALRKEYADCDIVLFPSLYEGFGLPIIEGFQSGKPVVTSAREPMNSLAVGAAYLADPESVFAIRQAVLHLMSDADERNSKIEKGKAIATMFHPAGIGELYAGLWSQLLCAE